MPAKSKQVDIDQPSNGLLSNKNRDERLSIGRFVLFFAILVAGLATDLVTKSVILGKYPPNQMQPEWKFIDGVLGIQTSTNGGALFGMGQGYSVLFAGLSILALLAIIFWLFAKKLARSLWLTITLAMISGGILGNFYDRVGWGYDPSWNMPEVKNHVRDWIHFRLEGVSFFDPWPNFNIADSLLVCGAFMLFIFAMFGMDGPLKADANESTIPGSTDESGNE